MHLDEMRELEGKTPLSRAQWVEILLQCVAACYSVLQCVAACCTVLQCGQRYYYSVLQRVALCCSVLHCVAMGKDTIAVCCSVV